MGQAAFTHLVCHACQWAKQCSASVPMQNRDNSFASMLHRVSVVTVSVHILHYVWSLRALLLDTLCMGMVLLDTLCMGLAPCECSIGCSWFKYITTNVASLRGRPAALHTVTSHDDSADGSSEVNTYHADLNSNIETSKSPDNINPLNFAVWHVC